MRLHINRSPQHLWDCERMDGGEASARSKLTENKIELFELKQADGRINTSTVDWRAFECDRFDSGSHFFFFG